ncbi:MAG: MerR family transcriptional regulator [Pseudomonadota bacterium]|nr:MerR family transcriptional regulator [Pseudomonadota bacterium]
MYIGAVAQQTGLSLKAIRLYEAKGLISVPQRVGRYRHYSAQQLQQLILLRDARAFGLSIRQLQQLTAQQIIQASHIRVLLQQRQQQLQQQVVETQRQLDQLADCLHALDTCPQLQSTGIPIAQKTATLA